MAQEFSTTFRVEQGVLKIRNRKGLEAWAGRLRNCEGIAHFEKAHATRTRDQNALYWAGYINPLCEYTGYSPREMHAYLKKRFLPKLRIDIVDKRTGAVVDEQDLEAFTTTTLNKLEFGDYLREIEEFALGLNVTVGTNREQQA